MASRVSALSLVDKGSSADPGIIALDTAKEVLFAAVNKPVAPVDQVTGHRSSTNYAVQSANLRASAPPIAHETSSEMQSKFHGPAMAIVQGEARQNLGKLCSCFMPVY
jgi:cytolysin (calcineurin-like family phosphatase)